MGQGHARWVRLAHGLIAAVVLMLAYSGVVILMAQPRLYWGWSGNDLTQPLLELPLGRNDHHGDSIDLVDRLHPQTILAYGMNGRDLPVGHGAPARLRVETQMGYKSVKSLRRIEVVEKFDDFGKKGNIQNGWSWYAGI